MIRAGRSPPMHICAILQEADVTDWDTVKGQTLQVETDPQLKTEH